MVKEELISEVSQETGYGHALVRDVIEATIESIKSHVCKQDAVTLRGFGTFTVSHKGDRMGRNVTKGIEVLIPAHYTPHFKPAKSFKQDVDLHGKYIEQLQAR